MATIPPNHLIVTRARAVLDEAVASGSRLRIYRDEWFNWIAHLVTTIDGVHHHRQTWGETQAEAVARLGLAVERERK
jgi:hypothetical protein